jgi:hypothetical protein
MTTFMPDDLPRLATAEIPMPILSDEAVVQIHDFIHHVLDQFEALYGDKLRHFYEGLYEDWPIEPDGDNQGTAGETEPPF